MKRKISYFFKKENGDMIILFSGILVVLIFFIGLSLDVGMMVLHRNSMQNLCQLVREDRFTYQDTIRYADNPGLTSYQIIYDTMMDNNFDGTVKVYFYEEIPKYNYRHYRVRTELSKEYNYTFARLFGLTTTTITVSMDGGETYGESLNDVVWYSSIPVSKYNGSYSSLPNGQYEHIKHDIPADW